MKLDPCEPPRWARTGHLQTLMGYILPSEAVAETGKDLWIPLPDGDRLHSEFFPGDSSTLILLFHGLNGDIHSNYMERTTRLALRRGHGVARVNHRDCGKGQGFARHPYHSGRGEDVSEVIAFYRRHFPGKRLVAIGFSLGANALLNLLCGLRGTEQPDFAIAVNGPADLKACSDLLRTGWNRIYDFNFLLNSRKEIRRKAKQGRIDFSDPIPLWANLRTVDELYTAPFGGFKNAESYYAECSTSPHFDKIKTPTLMFMSKDDPFIPWQPYLSARKNPAIHLHLENHGGHLGYLSRSGPSMRWLDTALAAAFDHYLK